MTGKLPSHIAVSYISFKNKILGVFKAKIGLKLHSFLVKILITEKSEKIIYL